MKCLVTFRKVKSVDKIEGYWTPQDYIEILDAMNFDGGESANPSELEELVHMAITDFEPAEAAEILLTYKLSEQLNKGQISNIAHEMLEDKVAEEYPVIALHYPLFNINQLLWKAYNGTFPHTKGCVIELDLEIKSGPATEITKEVILKAMVPGLRDKNLIIRLFHDQLAGKLEFGDAKEIIWELHKLEGNRYRFNTSDYWLNEEDIIQQEFTTTVNFWEDDED